MADVNIKDQSENKENGLSEQTTTTPDSQSASEPKTYEEVMKANAELIKKNAEAEITNRKNKQALDKALSRLAQLEKDYRNKLSADEQAEIERQEANAKKQEEFEHYKKYHDINEAAKRYMAVGMDHEIALQAAEAEYNGDRDLTFELLKKSQEANKRSWEAEFYKNRPPVNAGGGGSSVTQEEFDRMNMIERTKLFNEQPDVYNRLLANSK